MKRPNILFILTDQQRRDTLSCYDGEICQTPHLDTLAEDSVIFDNAYTVCPVCTPARASIQTGLYPMHHGMQANSYSRGSMVHELADTPDLLSRRLAEQNYAVGYTGKWHLGEGPSTQPPETHNVLATFPEDYYRTGMLPSQVGYRGDDFPGHGDGGYKYPAYQDFLKENGLSFDCVNENNATGTPFPRFGEVTSGVESTCEYFITQRAQQIIDELSREDRPFFCMVNYWGPHEPYYAPTEFLDLYRDVHIPPWENFDDPLIDKPSIHNIKRQHRNWSEWERIIRYYYGFMSSIDAQVGRLLDYLRAKNYYDDTLIIFSSDHGESLGIHAGLSDKSFFLYDETCRIPLMIKPAGQSPTPRREDRFAGTCDLYSTILDTAGCPLATAQRDGRSLAPLLRQEDIPDWPDCIVTESSGLMNATFTSRMLRYGNYKYIFNCGDIDELYNLEADPSELNNLVNDPEEQDTLHRLRQRLARWMQDHDDRLLEAFQAMRPIKSQPITPHTSGSSS